MFLHDNAGSCKNIMGNLRFLRIRSYDDGSQEGNLQGLFNHPAGNFRVQTNKPIMANLQL